MHTTPEYTQLMVAIRDIVELALTPISDVWDTEDTYHRLKFILLEVMPDMDDLRNEHVELVDLANELLAK